MKKKVPLQVHEFIEPYLDKKGDHFHTISPNGFMLRFVDSDSDSDFYFNIEQHKTEREFQLLIDFKPFNKQSISNRRTWIKAQELQSYFDTWLKLLDGYNKVKTVYDDPIIESFANDFYDEFELIDDDVDKAPLKTQQILLLDEHLDLIEKGLIKYIDEDNVQEIKLIQEGIAELKQNMSKQTKKWVLKKLSKIWGQIAKQGVPLIKEFLSDVKKEFIKQGVKYILNGGTQ